MIRMVKVRRQSVSFCKYVVAGLLWLAVLLRSTGPVWFVLLVMAVSAVVGIHRAPLVRLFDLTAAKRIKTEEITINLYSMRFAQWVGAAFCAAALLLYYFVSPFGAFLLTAVLAAMQSVAAFGFCSAQKLYECVVCNNNCCNLGKRVRRLKRDV